MEYRRNLPHIQPQGAMFFITIRLYASVPLQLLEQWNNDYKNVNNTDLTGKPIKELKQEQQESYFEVLDDYLDKNENGPYYLADEQIANLVKEALHCRDGKDYKLVCYCIMSNHMHFIIYHLQQPLHIVLKEFKSYTGKEAMKVVKNLAATRELARPRARNNNFNRNNLAAGATSSLPKIQYLQIH